METKKKQSTAKKVVVNKVSLKSGTGREDLYEVGKNKPPKATQFSATRQPDPKAISAGMKRRNFTRDVIKEMLNMPYKFTEESQIKKQLVQAFGEGVLELSTAEVMTLQQMQKGILKADTQAYNVLIEQALGKQVQPVNNVDSDGNDMRPIMLTAPKGMKFELPSNTEGDGEDEEEA